MTEWKTHTHIFRWPDDGVITLLWRESSAVAKATNGEASQTVECREYQGGGYRNLKRGAGSSRTSRGWRWAAEWREAGMSQQGQRVSSEGRWAVAQEAGSSVAMCR